VCFILLCCPQKVAPDEVKEYGVCRPYSKIQKNSKDKNKDSVAANYFSSPLIPSAVEEETGVPYPGPKCQRLTRNPSTLIYFWKAAKQVKEMLTVAPSYHGGLDDIMAELPEFRYFRRLFCCFFLLSCFFFLFCFIIFILYVFFFRFSITREEFDEEIKDFLDYFKSLCEEFKKEIISNGFVSANGNSEKLVFLSIKSYIHLFFCFHINILFFIAVALPRWILLWCSC
jgi:hypothetical protein